MTKITNMLMKDIPLWYLLATIMAYLIFGIGFYQGYYGNC